MVNKKFRDVGVLTVLLRRMYSQRLPRILLIKDRVERGECLNDNEIKYLHQVLSDAREIQPTIERYPEYHPLAAQLVGLYKEVIEKALENEKRRAAP